MTENRRVFLDVVATYGRSLYGLYALWGGSSYLLPVIVKPTDGAGSKGVTKVEKPSDLPSAIATALAAAIRDPSQGRKIVMRRENSPRSPKPQNSRALARAFGVASQPSLRNASRFCGAFR